MIIALEKDVDDVELAHFGAHGAALKRSFLRPADKNSIRIPRQIRLQISGDDSDFRAALTRDLRDHDVVFRRSGIRKENQHIFRSDHGRGHRLHVGVDDVADLRGDVQEAPLRLFRGDHGISNA